MGIRLVVFVLVFLAAPAFAAGASSWRQIESAGAPGEVATWVRPVEDSPIKEFRGEVVLPVGPVPVLALLADLPALPAFRAMDFQGWLDNAVDGK